MTDKPNPKDFPFNYVVQWWNETDGENDVGVDCSTYQQAVSVVRQRFPTAWIDPEWDPALHEKNVYGSSQDAYTEEADDDPASIRVATIERRRDAYDAAHDEWVMENSENSEEYDPIADAPAGNGGDTEICQLCGGNMDEVGMCEDCGKFDPTHGG